MKGLQTVHAIFKEGRLVFADPALAPKDGVEVVVTYFEEAPVEEQQGVDPLQALRGRGQGEQLVERLLESRRLDWEDDERSRGHLRA